MHGYHNGLNFVRDLIVDVDVLCLQEHWLRKSIINSFNQFQNFKPISYSAMSDEEISAGRPFGGLAILCKTSSVDIISEFGISMNNRAMGILSSTNKQRYLLFNVYCLCKGQKNFASEVEIICAYITSVINNINMNDVLILIAGDFNADLKLINKNVDLLSLHDLMDQYDLTPSSNFYAGDVKYTFSNDIREVYTFLDNILIS